MNISVFGLGYVGVVNLACLSKLGHTIYGCDIKPHKVALISSGKSTVLEPQVPELIQEGTDKGLIHASQDARHVVESTEMALICVGTPSRQDGTVNLDYCINTVIEIATILKDLDKEYTIVFRSTIPPGTVDQKLRPELDRILGDAVSKVTVIFMPEFLREGSAVKDFFHCARIVVGCDMDAPQSEPIKEAFSYSEEIPLIWVNYRTAEFVKYVDNAYHATKVAFANEAYTIGSQFDVDIKKANEIFLMDDTLNISKRYLRPGLPFGGSCLPKDVRAIINLGNVSGVDIPFFKNVLESNTAHQRRLFDKVMSFDVKEVLIHGLTFKQNTDDVRESPMLILAKDLIVNGMDVKIHDPNLNISNLRVEVPEIVKYIHTDLDSLVKWSKLIVVYRPDIDDVIAMATDGQSVLNLIDNDSHDDGSGRVHNLY